MAAGRTKLFAVSAIGILLAVVACGPRFRYGYGLADTGDYFIATVLFGGLQTTYAPGFSEERFGKVRLGMSNQQVHALLGEPVVRIGECWRYANQVTATDSFHLRDILFSDDGKVSRIDTGVYLD